MYRLINLNNTRTPLETSRSLADLFIALDKPEYKYKTPVIVDETGEIVAGSSTAWDRAQHINFSIKGGEHEHVYTS